MKNLHRWEELAKNYYTGTQWDKASISAGRAMDNRLNTVARDLFGQEAESGSFDMAQWLAWFDPEVLKRRAINF